jgi:hypothetical protein
VDIAAFLIKFVNFILYLGPCVIHWQSIRPIQSFADAQLLVNIIVS